MNREVFFTEVLLRAKESFECRKDIELATILGISAQVLGNRKKTHSVPYDEIIAAAMERGADVQYILTGVRSGAALAPDERLLLERYRASPQSLKDAAFRVLLGGEASAPAFSINGDVGQSIHSPQGSTFKVDMRKERKK